MTLAIDLAFPSMETVADYANLFLGLLPFILAILIPLAVFKILTRKKNYSAKMIEIKEAPIEINNLLRDSVKRNILRSLSKEKKYMTAIAEEINENAPRLRYHLKQLEKANILKSFKLARESYFTLSKKGQWCLDAINYYYPTTTLQMIGGRLKRLFGVFKIRKFMPREGKRAVQNKNHLE